MAVGTGSVRVRGTVILAAWGLAVGFAAPCAADDGWVEDEHVHAHRVLDDTGHLAPHDVAGVWPRATLIADGPGTPPDPRTAPVVDVYGRRAADAAPYAPPSTPLYTPGGYGAEREGARVGPYHQPEWTTQRRWARVRAYVLAPWQVEVESWWYGKYPEFGEDGTHLFQEEIGIGLPHRFQLDLYGNFEKRPNEDPYYKETQLELRWALADWGCLPLNPTLYGEYKLRARAEDPDVAELKLLLADELSPRWHYGLNLVYERELDGEEEEVLGAAAALSYTVCDQRFSVGLEAQVERVTVAGARDDAEVEWLLGPSFQVRFGPRTHLDVVPLFGLTEESSDLKVYAVFGIDVGPCSVEDRYGGPTALRSR